MINLLPPKEKNNLKREKQYKLISILCFLVLFFLISLSLILFSLKTYISAQAESQRITFQIAQEQYQKSQYKDLEAEINLINSNLSKLNSFYQDRTDWTVLVERISELVPVQAYLTAVLMSPAVGEESKFQVSLAGFCSDRDILLGFKKRLEAEDDFQEVNFPPSNWLQSKDINFSATLKVIAL